jgi:hypothetical protein
MPGMDDRLSFAGHLAATDQARREQIQSGGRQAAEGLPISEGEFDTLSCSTS